MDKGLQITEILELIPEGVTEPIKCRLSDGSVVVAKYPNNNVGTAAVANEYIGFSLAKAIGITVPDFAICELSQNAIDSVNDFEEIDNRNRGPCFCSRLLDKAVPTIIRGRVRNKETEKIILFDHIVNNFDRHEGNLLTDMSSCLLYAIDYSHIFSKGPYPDYKSEYFRRGSDSQSYLYTDILESNEKVYDALCMWVGYDEKTMRKEAKRIAQMLTPDYVEEVLSDMPEEWVAQIGGASTIRDIEAFINFRLKHIDRICELVISEYRR